jgi:hypothetical protein
MSFLSCRSTRLSCATRPQGASLLLATLGLAFLFLAARHRDPPLVAIAALSPGMNFARVRVEGRIVGRPLLRTTPARPQLAIGLSDPSGALLRAVAYDETARAFAARGLTLRAGQHVRVEGSLRLDANRTPRLYLCDGNAVTLLTPPALTEGPPRE